MGVLAHWREYSIIGNADGKIGFWKCELQQNDYITATVGTEMYSHTKVG